MAQRKVVKIVTVRASPQDGAIIIRAEALAANRPMMTFPGETLYVCGCCSLPAIEGTPQNDEMHNMVLQCSCGSYMIPPQQSTQDN